MLVYTKINMILTQFFEDNFPSLDFLDTGKPRMVLSFNGTFSTIGNSNSICGFPLTKHGNQILHIFPHVSENIFPPLGNCITMYGNGLNHTWKKALFPKMDKNHKKNI